MFLWHTSNGCCARGVPIAAASAIWWIHTDNIITGHRWPRSVEEYRPFRFTPVHLDRSLVRAHFVYAWSVVATTRKPHILNGWFETIAASFGSERSYQSTNLHNKIPILSANWPRGTPDTMFLRNGRYLLLQLFCWMFTDAYLRGRASPWNTWPGVPEMTVSSRG